MSDRPHGISRRHFFFGTLLAGVVPRAGFGSVPSLKQLGFQSPNEKLNIAGIGSGGRAMSVLGGCDSENIVALADVDWVRGAEGFKRWEKATRYKDFRQMLDKQGKGIDAVTVVIPDHMHTYAALTAMQLGKHVYVEKPLTRTPWEARLLTDAAAKYKVATQMGNQGYSHDATRVASEIIWSGEIGNVTEVFAFRGNAGWPQGMTSLPPTEKVPDTLDWDLWLGTAAWRDYTSGDDAWRKQYDESQVPASICRSTGVGSSISARASLATGAFTSSVRRTGRCNSAARPASSARSSATARVLTRIHAAASPCVGTSRRAAACRRSPCIGRIPATRTFLRA